MKIREQIARHRAARIARATELPPYDPARDREEEKREANEQITQVIVCRKTGRLPCTCGRPSNGACAYPLRGRKAGQTCGKPLCEKHTYGDPGYCLTHEGMRDR